MTALSLSASQDFSPYIAAFSTACNAILHARPYRPILIASSISVTSRPYHEGATSDSYSCYVEAGRASSTRNPEQTATIVDALFAEFSEILNDAKTDWEKAASEHGHVKMIELDVSVHVISSTETLTKEEFYDACGFSANAIAYVTHLPTILHQINQYVAGEILIAAASAALLEFFPALATKSPEAIVQLIKDLATSSQEDSDAFCQTLCEAIGIPSMAGVSDDDEAILAKLSVDETGKRVSDVFTFTLTHSV